MFAALNIHKPKGCTSHDVVAAVRRIYGLRRVGHMGTLDPMATGVLPLCLGTATRLIEYFPTDKRYRADITFGVTTTTLDAEGEVITTTPAAHLSEAEILAVLPAFLGEQQQEVPAYSAVKVKGKKLYELARAREKAALDSPSPLGERGLGGEGPLAILEKLPSKPITIYALENATVAGVGTDHPVLTVDIHCSGGTYIRSLARDIGYRLGVGAHMSALERTAHGNFPVAEAVEYEMLKGAENPAQYLLDPLQFVGLPQLPLASEDECARIRNGMKIQPENLSQPLKSNQRYMVTFAGQPVCVAEAMTGEQYANGRVAKQLRPLKVFAPD
ncbi:MAG: tRNA pseudouridine(55) synthase TruB [Candidatus Melainabacteria bacterium]